MRVSWFHPVVAFVFVIVSTITPQVYGADTNHYNVEDDRIIPLGALAEGVTTVAKVGDDYVLKFVGDETIEYRIDTTHADFAIGVVRVTEATSGAILMRGGQRFRYASTPEGPGGSVWNARQVPGGTTVTPLADNIRNEIVVLDYQHEYSGVTHQVRYLLSIEGKSLKVRSYSLTPENTDYGNNYFGFDLAEHGNMTNPQYPRIAFMEQVPVTFYNNNWFFSNFVDMNNSRCGHRRYRESLRAPLQNYVYPYYYKMTDGSINHPVDDTVWLTVSSKIEDIFVDTDNYPMSPHRVTANKAAVVRQSGDRGYANVEAGLRKKFNAGFFNSQQYFWNWQWNYININDPTMYPPNPSRGTTPEYNSMMDYMNSIGNTLGLYYTIELMDPGYSFDCNIWHGQGGANPSYDTTYLNRNSSGAPKNGWDTSVDNRAR